MSSLSFKFSSMRNFQKKKNKKKKFLGMSKNSDLKVMLSLTTPKVEFKKSIKEMDPAALPLTIVDIHRLIQRTERSHYDLKNLQMESVVNINH